MKVKTADEEFTDAMEPRNLIMSKDARENLLRVAHSKDPDIIIIDDPLQSGSPVTRRTYRGRDVEIYIGGERVGLHTAGDTIAVVTEHVAGASPRELHNEVVERMLDAGTDKDGRYTDPVSGRLFPEGSKLVKNPSREERRRLKHWRKTGKVAKRKSSKGRNTFKGFER